MQISELCFHLDPFFKIKHSTICIKGHSRLKNKWSINKFKDEHFFLPKNKKLYAYWKKNKNSQYLAEMTLYTSQVT